MTEEGLIPRQTVEMLVREYEAAQDTIRKSFAALENAEKRLQVAFTKDSLSINDKYHRRTMRWDDAEGVLVELRRDCWGVIVERLELRRMLSASRMKALDDQLRDSTEWPDITQESVLLFAREHMCKLDCYLQEAVEEVFDHLRPPGSQYKTNTELEIGRKCILQGHVEEGFGAHPFRASYHYQPRMAAIDKVFSALDGCGSVTSSHYGPLCDAITATGDDGRFQTKYFKGRCFKNGNLHLEFLRLDLLQRFNEMAGGKRLRPRAA